MRWDFLIEFPPRRLVRIGASGRVEGLEGACGGEFISTSSTRRGNKGLLAHSLPKIQERLASRKPIPRDSHDTCDAGLADRPARFGHRRALFFLGYIVHAWAGCHLYPALREGTHHVPASTSCLLHASDTAVEHVDADATPQVPNWPTSYHPKMIFPMLKSACAIYGSSSNGARPPPVRLTPRRPWCGVV